MGKVRLKGGCALVSGVLVVCSAFMSPWVRAGRAGDAPPHVELDCKIAPASTQRSNWWEVEVRRPTGELVRLATVTNGDATHFKNLDPGIYSVCIVGTENRERCESVDLNPPPNKTSFRFSKYLKTPERLLNLQSFNKVSRVKLAVPAQARDELYRSEQAQIRGDEEQAVQHLKRAIEIYPSYADALNNLGTYYHRVGRQEESIECFRKVTSLEPEFYGGWVNLGGSLLATAQFKEAMEANTRAYQLRPSDSLVISQLALNYYYLHNMSEAKELFLRLLTLDPVSAVEPHLFLVHIALAEQNKEEAKEYMNEFLKIHPNAPEAKHLRELLVNIDSIRFSSGADVAQSKQ